MRHLERMILLDIVDSKWKEHLRGMDNVPEGIGLRAYGQKDPLVEYKREAFEAFQAMIQSIKEDALEFIFRVQPMDPERLAQANAPAKKATPLQFLHPEAGSAIPKASRMSDVEVSQAPVPLRAAGPATTVSEQKVGRNDPCPCGSGKKYKKCHGQ